MMNRDTATGVVGAIILVAAMAGVFLYERAQFEPYSVDWEMETVASTTASGNLDEGDSAEHRFTVEADRLAQVKVRLSWQDGAGQPDTFELRLEGPDGELAQEASGDSSPLEALVLVEESPGTDTVTARSPTDARDQLNFSASWSNGSGEWLVTVTLTSAPGDQLGLEEDGSQRYQLTFEAQRWAPVIT